VSAEPRTLVCGRAMTPIVAVPRAASCRRNFRKLAEQGYFKAAPGVEPQVSLTLQPMTVMIGSCRRYRLCRPLCPIRSRVYCCFWQQSEAAGVARTIVRSVLGFKRRHVRRHAVRTARTPNRSHKRPVRVGSNASGSACIFPRNERTWMRRRSGRHVAIR